MLELFRAGGPVMVPLLLCSVIAVGVIVERALFWGRAARGTEGVVSRVLAAAEGGPAEGGPAEDGGGPAEAAGRMRLAAEREVARLGRNLSVLSTLVSLAPLLGIFGTVLGIMESFQFFDAAALSAPEAAKLGLAKALITTAFGLAIAMVSLIALKVFQARVAMLRHELEIRCTEKEIALGLAKHGVGP